MRILYYKEIEVDFQDFINDIDFKLERCLKLNNENIFNELSFEFLKSVNNLILKYQIEFKTVKQCKRLKTIMENIFK